jgi:hypothetical protein
MVSVSFPRRRGLKNGGSREAEMFAKQSRATVPASPSPVKKAKFSPI